MWLYVKLFLVTAPTLGLAVALLQGETESLGEYLEAAALFGIPFGVLFSAIVGTMQIRGERKELERRERLKGAE
jgi:sensor c-di-GMP phosphodiesterase-like protein